MDPLQLRIIAALLWALLVATTLLYFVDGSTDGPLWTVWSNAFYASTAAAAILVPRGQISWRDDRCYYSTLFPAYLFHIACASYTYHRTSAVWAQQWDTTAINLYALFEIAVTTHPVVLIASPASPFLPAPLFPATVVAALLAYELFAAFGAPKVDARRIAGVSLSTAAAIVAATFFILADTGVEHGLWHVFSAAGIFTFYVTRINIGIN